MLSDGLLVLFTTMTPLSAATITWDGDGNVNFTNSANWVGGVAPTGADIADFRGSVAPVFQPNRSTNAGDVTLASGLVGGESYAMTLGLTQNVGASNVNFFLGGDGITTGAAPFAIVNQATLANRPARLNLTADQTWNLGSGGLTISSGSSTLAIAGSATLTKTGAGTLTYNGVNNIFTGTLVISSGTVITTSEGGNIIGNPGAITNVFVLNGSTAVLSQNAALGNRGIFIGTEGGTFLARNGGAGGGQNFSANNQFNGGGAFVLDLSSFGTDPLATSSLTISGANGGYSGHFTLVAAGEDRIVAGNNQALGDGASAGHSLTISSSNTAADSLTISHGVNLGVGTLAGNGSAKISTSASAINQSGTLTVNQSVTGTYAGTFTTGTAAGGAFTLVKNGAGGLVLAGSSTSWGKGAVTINDGTLLVQADNALGGSLVGVTLSSATLASDLAGLSLANKITTSGTGSVLDPTGSLTVGALDVTNGITLRLDGGEALAVSGTLTGAGSDGTFVLDLSGGFISGSPVTIVTFGASTSVDTADFSLASGALYSLDSVILNAGSVQVILTSVPEPSGLFLAALGLLSVAFRRRAAHRGGLTL